MQLSTILVVVLDFVEEKIELYSLIVGMTMSNPVLIFKLFG